MQPSYSSYEANSGNGYIDYGSAGGGGANSSPYAQYGNGAASSSHTHQLQYGGDDDYDDVDDMEEDLMQRASMLHVMSEQEKLRYARDMTTRNRR